MRKKSKRLTKIIIDGTLITTKEEDVKEFELEVAPSDRDIIFYRTTIKASKLDDFTYVGTTKKVIGNLTVGVVYSFRIRSVKSNGQKSIWSEWANETAGDTVNEIVFSIPLVTESSSGVGFQVSTNSIPQDFDRFEWKVEESDVLLSGNPTLYNPDTPSSKPGPDDNAVPDFVTNATDKIFLSFSGDKTKWKFVWIRALDSSGNIGADGWYFLGYGRELPIDLQTDYDNTPPDATEINAPVFTGVEELNFI